MNIEYAKRGRRVRCVNGNFERRNTDPFRLKDIMLPREGEIYTIREVINTADGLGVRLLEIQSERFLHHLGGMQEPCFSPERFEPVE